MKASIKNLILTAALGMSIFSFNLASPVLAEEEVKPEADLTTGFYSQYIWRGWAYSKDSLVIQPSMTVSYKGFGVNLWGNLDTDQYAADSDEQKSNFNETDFTLSYDGSAGKIGYGTGFIYYGLDGVNDSQEMYITASYDTILAPSLTIYKEITGIQGWYANLSISHTLPLTQDIGLDLGASAGYYDDEANYNELHDGVLSASVSIPVAEYITVTPELHYSFSLSSKASDRLKADNLSVINDNEDNFIYGGVSASISF